MKATWFPFVSRHVKSRFLVTGLILFGISISFANAQVNVTCPEDMSLVNDPGVCSADVEFPDPIVTGTNATDTVTVVPPSGSTFPVGTNEVVVTVSDESSNPLGSCRFDVIVIDVEPPTITDASVNKSTLWPPNHKMVNITVDYNDVDNCDSNPRSSLSVHSNESDNGLGDGNTSDDWEVVDAHHVRLRAERSGTGGGRTYTITITSTDRNGNSSSKDVTVLVPHDRGNGKGGKGKGKGGSGNGHKP